MLCQLRLSTIGSQRFFELSDRDFVTFVCLLAPFHWEGSVGYEQYTNVATQAEYPIN